MFKKIARLGSMATLALSLGGGVLFATTATVAAAPGASQYCAEIIAEEGLPNNGAQGACTSFYESNGISSASNSYFCKIELVPEGAFTNQGECVSTLNALMGK